MADHGLDLSQPPRGLLRVSNELTRRKHRISGFFGHGGLKFP
jgi:hypothetical protein